MTTLSALQDTELLELITRGDRSALAELYDRYASSMLAVAGHILRDATQAEDLVHEVFLEAWRVAERYSPSRGAVRTWLFVRLRSRAIDRIRAQSRRPDVGLEEAELESRVSSKTSSYTLDRRSLLRAFDLLPDAQRRVLEAAYFGGLTCSEIAAREAIPIGTVKSRLAAALRKLREALRDDMWEVP